MTTVLNGLLDALLAGSLALFLAALIQMVVREPNASERLLRSMALVAGAVVALGAQAAGVTFASYIVSSLAGAHPGGSLFKAFSVIVPGGIAAGFGWYFLRVMRKSATKGLRLMSFLGMLTVVGFAEIYAQATKLHGLILGAAAIPNASFVSGLILSLLLLAPEPNAGPPQGPGPLATLRAAFRRRAPRAAAFFSQPTEHHATGAARPPDGLSNPFAED